ncbi:MAG: glycoside hydrolase [Limnochordaceae bacterium]|nr:glycoside hydrolase [Limnochordaceae bacterium]
MAQHLVIYTVIHQPRRLKLPAQPIPKGAVPADIERCLFDERMNRRYLEKVAATCYHPATEMFLELADRGLKLSVGFSWSFLRQAQMWDEALMEKLRRLARHPNVEVINVEPYHSFLFYVDMDAFVRRMRETAEMLRKLFDLRSPVAVTDTTEMFMANDIYFALEQAGFRGAFMDGRPWVLGWRQPSYLYHYNRRLYLLTRHYQLSDDVGYRFSNRSWALWPLYADTYARWIAEASGDVVTVGWDYETFGEHHWKETGIFDFMRALPRELERQGVETLLPGEAIAKLRDRSHHLPLPAFPTTWAGEGGVDFFLGNGAQQAVFQLMHHVYHKALLTQDPAIIDLAMWLLQSDNLHLIQWFGRSGSEAEVSAYFTPREWWRLGPHGIIHEIQQVFRNFLVAMDAYLTREVLYLPGQKPPPVNRRRRARPELPPIAPLVPGSEAAAGTDGRREAAAALQAPRSVAANSRGTPARARARARGA